MREIETENEAESSRKKEKGEEERPCCRKTQRQLITAKLKRAFFEINTKIGHFAFAPVLFGLLFVPTYIIFCEIRRMCRDDTSTRCDVYIHTSWRTYTGLRHMCWCVLTYMHMRRGVYRCTSGRDSDASWRRNVCVVPYIYIRHDAHILGYDICVGAFWSIYICVAAYTDIHWDANQMRLDEETYAS